ncbi:MAG: EAL domain-containing protein [Bacillota bacterium]|nr:EAL domain-containing protein [Bacillota bacterium]
MLTILFCLFSCFSTLAKVLLTKSYGDIPGIVSPITNIIIITIIYFYYTSLNKKVNQVLLQKEDLTTIYEEVLTAEEELSNQNIKLKNYNKLMEDNKEKLWHLANYDTLTDLPNRKMILNRINYLIEKSSNSQLKFSLVFIDLDNFKNINDTMGHYVGDLMLQSITSRLNNFINSKDILGRLGGDEFALIIQRNLNKEEILNYVELLRNILLSSFSLNNNRFRISSSYGISIFPDHGTTSSELLKNADIAMYSVKEQGKNGIRFFTKEMKYKNLKKLELEQYLKKSINNNELFLEFQPEYSIETKEIRGFEALVRWNSENLGLIYPSYFIPSAEETGFIIQIGRWVLEKTCENLKKWHNKYNKNISASVNISSFQIMDPNFVDSVKDILIKTGIKGENLEFEFTESIFINQINYTIDVIKKLKELGIKMVLDDFGTGYSSLCYIKMLPIDILKIDKSFIDGIDTTEKKDTILSSLISLIHSLNIIVLSEGVETEIQLQYLKDYKCDYVQGFLLNKPLSEENIEKLLENAANS